MDKCVPIRRDSDAALKDKVMLDPREIVGSSECRSRALIFGPEKQQPRSAIKVPNGREGKHREHAVTPPIGA
jgi:hypothetical protein